MRLIYTQTVHCLYNIDFDFWCPNVQKWKNKFLFHSRPPLNAHITGDASSGIYKLIFIESSAIPGLSILYTRRTTRLSRCARILGAGAPLWWAPERAHILRYIDCAQKFIFCAERSIMNNYFTLISKTKNTTKRSCIKIKERFKITLFCFFFLTRTKKNLFKWWKASLYIVHARAHTQGLTM